MQLDIAVDWECLFGVLALNIEDKKNRGIVNYQVYFIVYQGEDKYATASYITIIVTGSS